jgi:hypothetical protein
MLGDQQQHFGCCAPCWPVMLALRKLGDIVAGMCKVRSSPPSGRGIGSPKVRDQPLSLIEARGAFQI